MKLLQDKVVLITGASRGIGKAIAEECAKQGAIVAFTYISSEEKAKALEAELSVNGGVAKGFKSDAGNFDAAQQLVDDVVATYGTIDVLINNAGIIKRTPIIEMEVEDFAAVINVDLISPFIVSKNVAKGMIQRGGGKIINICSMMSELGRDSVSAYAAAKGGLKMLTKNMATEWAKYNIQTNGIGPGYFATSQTAPIRVDGHPFNEFIISRTPAARWGDPEDLQGAAIFLSSKASDFVNGHILYVDGGILATIGKPSNE